MDQSSAGSIVAYISVMDCLCFAILHAVRSNLIWTV